MPSPHRVPLWLMGLTNLSYGLYGGVVAFAVPRRPRDRNVPEIAIAGLTAVAFSPGFYAFLLSPILDVRFSRRWYAVALAIVASLTLVVAFLNLDHLVFCWKPRSPSVFSLPIFIKVPMGVGSRP